MEVQLELPLWVSSLSVEQMQLNKTQMSTFQATIPKTPSCNNCWGIRVRPMLQEQPVAENKFELATWSTPMEVRRLSEGLLLFKLLEKAVELAQLLRRPIKWVPTLSMQSLQLTKIQLALLLPVMLLVKSLAALSAIQTFARSSWTICKWTEGRVLLAIRGLPKVLLQAISHPRLRMGALGSAILKHFWFRRLPPLILMVGLVGLLDSLRIKWLLSKIIIRKMKTMIDTHLTKPRSTKWKARLNSVNFVRQTPLLITWITISLENGLGKVLMQ